MGKLFDSFFKNGEELKGEYGEYDGRIERRDDNTSYIYDKDGNFSGRIESYGDNVTVYDDCGRIVESGTYYDESDTVDTHRWDGFGKTYSHGNYRTRINSDLDYHKKNK